MKKEKIICTLKQAEETLNKNKIYILWYLSKQENNEIMLKATYHEWDEEYKSWYNTIEHQLVLPPFLPSYLLETMKPYEVLCFEIDEFDNIEEYKAEKEKQRFNNFISYEPNSKQNI